MRQTSADPFFDRPYEPSGSGDASWEKTPAASAAAPAQAPARSAPAPNLRPKRKVAALLGGKA